MSKFFEDTSIFENIVEFLTPHHEELRIMLERSGLHKVYKKIGDSYIFQDEIKSGETTPKALYRTYHARRSEQK